MDTEERDYLWHHFAFNAEQRLKAFNFFVVFSVFANGGVFAAAEKSSHGAVFVLIGGFVAALSVVFAVIDVRSQGLLKLAVPGLMEYEKRFAAPSRLFARDADRHGGLFRYTVAFRVLFAMQFAFGVGTIVYGVARWF
ncbi:MAG: hypothetical protein K8R60_07685 [Burkholderiales bacterium]|nr:hypothetical protein [Burkholderiales bacterium]